MEGNINGEIYELLKPDGLMQGIRSLGITDLKPIEQSCLLKVLSKPEL